MPAKTISEAWSNHRVFYKQGKRFNQRCVNNLNRLLAESGADLVICSGWKECDHVRQNMVQILNLNDVQITSEKYLGVTPDIDGGFRQDEIEAWVKEHNFKGRYVVLDDEEDRYEKYGHLVLTLSEQGLTDYDVAKALEILGV